MKNKLIVGYCPNFYKIINFEYNEDDTISAYLIKVYEEYIFKIDVNNNSEVLKIKTLDEVLAKYIDNYFFRKEMQSSLKDVRVAKSDNILHAVVEAIIKIFNRYEEGYTRNIYISRWI